MEKNGPGAIWRKKYCYDAGITVILALLPLLLYLYLLFPDTQKWFLGPFTLQANFSESVQYYVYLVSLKVYVLLLLGLWFISITDWFKYSLVPTLLVTCFQLGHILLDTDKGSARITVIGILGGLGYVFFLLFLSRKKGGNQLTDRMALTSNILELFSRILHNRMVLKGKLKKLGTLGQQKFRGDPHLHIRTIQMDLVSNDATGNTVDRPMKLGRAPKFFFALIVALIPFLLFSFKLFPNSSEMDLGFFTLSLKYYQINHFVWLINIKLVNFLLLLIWFCTATFILRYAILINMVIVILQMSSLIFSSYFKYYDEYEVFYGLPAILPIGLLLYLLLRLLRSQSQIHAANAELEQELDRIIGEMATAPSVTDLASRLEELQKARANMDPQEYIRCLRTIQELCSQELATFRKAQ